MVAADAVHTRRSDPIVQVRLLGPLQITHEGRDIPVPGRLARRLVTILALNAGQPVNPRQLVEQLWLEHPPADEVNALQQQVSRLRRSLRRIGPGVIESSQQGYSLRLPRSGVDLLELEDLLAAAHRANQDERATAVALDRLMRGWSGESVLELGDSEYGLAQSSRVKSLHVQAVELRADVGLALGQVAGLEQMLASAVLMHPFAEGIRSRLMIALARLGRSGEALEYFERGRVLLAEELGIDPSPELQAALRAVLNGEIGDGSLRVGGAEGSGDPKSFPTAGGERPVPRWATTLVGRDDDIRRITRLLSRPGIVTLTGPAGVGKTRLAGAAARGASDEFRMPGVFVDLAPLPSGSGIASALLDAFGMLTDTHEAEEESIARICDRLRRDPHVVVVDNCEHVISGAAKLITEISLRTDARLLCTSREPLSVPGETVWSVPPLAVPPSTSSPPSEVMASPSVRLFLERAARSAPSESLDERDAEQLVTLVRRLDGIPLALELAAGRLRTFGLEGLNERLGRTLAVLTVPRAGSARQQTIRGTVRWSYDLLNSDERRALERLSVFAGSFTSAAASAMIDLDVESAEVVLVGLVDRSLLTFDRATGRYRMLQIVADFASEMLAESGSKQSAEETMLAFYERMAHQVGEAVSGPAQTAVRRRVSDEHRNLIRALDLAGESEGKSSLQVDAARATCSRMTGDLWWAWTLNDERMEARRRIESVLAQTQLPAAQRGRLLTGAAFLELDRYEGPGPEIRSLRALAQETSDPVLSAWAQLLGATASARISTRLLPTFVPAPVRAALASELADAESAFTRAGDRWAAALASLVRALVDMSGGDPTSAGPHLLRGDAHVVACGDPWLTVKYLQARGIAAMLAGEMDDAKRAHSDALEVARRESLRESQATAHSQLGALALGAQDLDAAAWHFDACLSLVERLGILPAEAWPRNGLGIIARFEQRVEDSLAHHRRALELYRTVGHRVGSSYSRTLLGLTHIAAGQRDVGEDCLRVALEEAKEDNERAVAALALAGLAEAAAQTEPWRARRLMKDAEELLQARTDRSPLVPIPGGYEFTRISRVIHAAPAEGIDEQREYRPKTSR